MEKHEEDANVEFKTMALGVCELLWLKIILEDLKIVCEGPMKLYCDSKSIIDPTYNLVQHDHIKHVEVDIYFIKEKLDSILICTPFVLIEGQLANVSAKGLSGIAFQSIIIKLGMDTIYSPA